MDEIVNNLNIYYNLNIEYTKKRFGDDFINACIGYSNKSKFSKSLASVWLSLWKDNIISINKDVEQFKNSGRLFSKSRVTKLQILKLMKNKYNNLISLIDEDFGFNFYNSSCVTFRQKIRNSLIRDINQIDILLMKNLGKNSIFDYAVRRKSRRKSRNKRNNKSKSISSKKPYYVKIKPSKTENKKYTAIFYNKDKTKIKTTHFGAKGYSDYTKHKDPDRKKRYIERHKARENWNNPMSAGALSRYILWQYPSLDKSIKYYKNKFALKSL